MTRDEIVAAALEIVGDDTLDTAAEAWLNECLQELETYGYWKFLETSGALSWTIGDNNTAVPVTYSKGLSIPGVKQITFEALQDAITAFADTGTTPYFFSLFDDQIWIYPTPSGTVNKTGYFYGKITLLSSNTDLLTTCNIPTKWHQFFIIGTAIRGLNYSNDDRAPFFQQKWEASVVLMMADAEEFLKYIEQQSDRPSLAPRQEKK